MAGNPIQDVLEMLMNSGGDYAPRYGVVPGSGQPGIGGTDAAVTPFTTKSPRQEQRYIKEIQDPRNTLSPPYVPNLGPLPQQINEMIPQVLQMLVQGAQQNPGMMMQLASAVPGLMNSGSAMTAPAVTPFQQMSNDPDKMGDEVMYEKRLDRELLDPSNRLHPYTPPLNTLNPVLQRIMEDQKGRRGYQPEDEPELEYDDPPDLTQLQGEEDAG